ncbi:MarR family winged helix-turn-helix transcriptional regulator [Amycolatopsis sp. NPDC051061]|uniref:MarR family winged helix-turn-helix transcriptional regulator n=1 Tax=Amycolatopsis sp. NPDC051061 TaxID=3155042 RepID=UPI00342D0D79
MDALDLIEAHTAVMVRNFELLSRRTDIYDEVDRAGYLLLRTLEATGPADITTLAAKLGLDPSTVGRQVSAMTTAGLVERAPATGDRRRSIVVATAEGQARARRVHDRRRANLAEMFAGVPEEQLRVIGESFARYNQAVARQYDVSLLPD